MTGSVCFLGKPFVPLSAAERRELRLRAQECLLSLERLSHVVSADSAICMYWRMELSLCETLLSERVGRS